MARPIFFSLPAKVYHILAVPDGIVFGMGPAEQALPDDGGDGKSSHHRALVLAKSRRSRPPLPINC